MPFQPLDIPFGPLDTKTDERMLPPGALLVAENCSAQTVGGYSKRFGYTTLPSPGSIQKLANRGDQLLVVGPIGDLIAYDSGAAAWRTVGPIFPLGIPDAATSQTNVELDQSVDIKKGTRCTCNGAIVHAFVRTTTGTEVLRIRLAEVSTGGLISETTLDSGSFTITSIHAAAAGTAVVVFYTTSTQSLNVVKVDCSTRTITGPTVYQSGANVSATLQVMDCCPLNSTDVLVAWYSNTPNVRVARFDTTTMTTAAGPSVVSGDVVNSGLAVIGTTGEFGAILYHSTAAGGMRSALFNPSTTVQTVAPFTVEAVTSPAGVNCGLRRVDATNVLAVWDRAASGITKQRVLWTKITSAGAVAGPVNALFNVALASKPFAGDVGYGTTFSAINVWAGYDPQQTLFTVKIANLAYPSAMHAFRSAYNTAPPLGQLTDVDTLSTSSYAFSAPIGYKFLSTSTERAGWTTFGIEYRAASLFASVEALGNTYFSAGIPSRFDGVNAVEVNFSLYPQITQATAGSVASGGMDDGVYSYRALYEASDLNGNTDRSTPSVAVSATTTAGSGRGKVTLTVDNYTVARQGVFASALNISIFRTKAGESAYRLVGTLINDPTQASQTYVDQANDSTIGSNRLLYSNDSDAGAVIEREPPLSTYQLILHKNRLWGISAADRKVLFYSGELQAGEGPWFSTLQQVRIEAGGNITGIASMDDKLVIFKADRVFKMYGNGLNGLGTSNDLSDPLLITGDAGCNDFRSIVSADGGLYFMSGKGLYGISRGEELSYAGQAMDKYWTGYLTVLAANMLPDRQEIRFEIAGGTGTIVDALSGAPIASQKAVVNYATGQWTTHRNYLDFTPIDARVVGGVYYYALAGGSVYKESTSSCVDPSSTYVRMLIQTAWIKPTGFQGFCRVRRIGLLGNRRDAHQLTMNVENDYVSGTINTTETWTNAQIITFPQEQVSAHLTKQKGESFRVTIYDALNGGISTGAGFNAYGVQLYTKPIRGAFEKNMLQAARG